MSPGDVVDVSVFSAGHDLLDARMHRVVDALAAAGLRVEVFALGDPGDAPASASVVHATPRPRYVRRVLMSTLLPFRAHGRVLLPIAPEAVPFAALAAWLRRRKLAVDVYEDYETLARDRPLSPPARMVALMLVRLAAWLSARADVTAVADEHVPPRRARRRVVVRNYPVVDEFSGEVSIDEAPRSVYIGDVRRTRGLATMLAALERAPAWTLDVVGPVAPADVAWLDDWRHTSAAADRLRLHGRMPPKESWRLAKGAWAGLVLLEDTPAFRRAVPSKLYEYFAAGLAVVASDLPRVAELLRATGAGAVVGSAEEAAVVLERWAVDRAALLSARQASRAWAAANLTGPSPYDVLAHEVAALARGAALPPADER